MRAWMAALRREVGEGGLGGVSVIWPRTWTKDDARCITLVKRKGR